MHVNNRLHINKKPKKEIEMNSNLEATYLKHLDELETIWRQVGDIKGVPKALKHNLRVYISNPENLEDGELHPNTDAEISETIVLIEDAFRSIDGENPDISKKAIQFLKQTAHDRKFEQTQIAGNKFRYAVTKSENSRDRSDFKRVICNPSHRSLGWGWTLTRLRSQKELAKVGAELNLCVQSLDGAGEAYHEELLERSLEFWYLQKHLSPHALISVRPKRRNQNNREIEEIQGYNNDDIELNREVANLVLETLDASTDDFCEVGAFLAFAKGSFSYDHPHKMEKDTKYICYFWFDTDHVIVARRKLTADDYEDEDEQDDDSSRELDDDSMWDPVDDGDGEDESSILLDEDCEEELDELDIVELTPDTHEDSEAEFYDQELDEDEDSKGQLKWYVKYFFEE